MKNAITPLIIAAAIAGCTSPRQQPSSPGVGVKTFDQSGTETGAYAVTRDGVTRLPVNDGWTVTEPDGTVRPATKQESDAEMQHLMRILGGQKSQP